MAPDPSQWPDPPSSQDAFMQDLSRFHAQRGTNFDPNPKINGKLIDLFELFNVVQARGGYDYVSAEKLLWRKIGAEFGLGQNSVAAHAFALKTAFYRNLAAYALKRVYKQDPPPKEILEQVTAKGGDLRIRNVHNFRHPQNRHSLANGHESDSSDPDNRTPKPERDSGEDPGSATRTRGLRQAPQQRQIYQPDNASSRQLRNPQSQTATPQASPALNAHNSASHYSSAPPNGSVTDLPRQGHVALRPVWTPSNNEREFHAKVRRLREEHLAKMGRTPIPTTPMQPGTGFHGPNIYVRTLLALRSGIPQEQDYALHHLVKISHERGDKYRLDAFPGMLDGLVEKILEVCSLVYNVHWVISYSGEPAGTYVLDGLSGTPDILARLQGLPAHNTFDHLQTEDFVHKLTKCNEAALILRNMSMLDENARFMSGHRPLRDFMSLALNLPPKDSLFEMKSNVLDIAEQVTKHWYFEPDDPLYVSLLRLVAETSDRGVALSAIRAICRTSMELDETERSRISSVPPETLKVLLTWTFLFDEEVVNTCLDFLYQYTFAPTNVAILMNVTRGALVSLDYLIRQLSNLLMSSTVDATSKRVMQKAVPETPPEDIPDVPREFIDSIINLAEPGRSSKWLKSCLVEDSDRDVTQIQLWSAYTNRLGPRLTPDAKPLMTASDFIKNVSNTFKTANAQVVVVEGASGKAQKFIIKGIRARRTPINESGRPLEKCFWHPPGADRPCGEFKMNAEDMFDHIIEKHVGVMRDSSDRWDVADAKANAVSQQHRFRCDWARCQHFTEHNGTQDLVALGMHIKTHLPDAGLASTLHGRSHKRKHSYEDNVAVINGATALEDVNVHGHEARSRAMSYRDTWFDTGKNLAGLPLTSVLVLRNLARNIPRALTGQMDEKQPVVATPLSRETMTQLFTPVLPRLHQALAHNRSLAVNLYDLLEVIEKGMKR